MMRRIKGDRGKAPSNEQGGTLPLKGVAPGGTTCVGGRRWNSRCLTHAQNFLEILNIKTKNII